MKLHRLWLLVVALVALTLPANAQMSPLSGGGQMVRIGPAYPLAGLPPAAQTRDQLFLIKDGTSTSDCATGGGTSYTLCYSTGSAYTALLSGGGQSLAPTDSPTFVGLTLTGLTASQMVGTTAGKALVSVATTGTGSAVLATSPTLVTPILGVAAATSINRLTITAPATGSTLTIADGKTLTVSNIVTLAGTDSSSITFGHGGAIGYIADAANTACATTCGTNTCVFGWDDGTVAGVACATATADHCVCKAA